MEADMQLAKLVLTLLGFYISRSAYPLYLIWKESRATKRKANK